MHNVQVPTFVSWHILVAIVVFNLLEGCATTPRGPVYLQDSARIGIAIVSPPTATIAHAGGLASQGFSQGAFAPLAGGGAQLGPVAILAMPFAAVYGAVRGAQCQQKLDAAYLDATARFPAIAEREFVPDDLRKAFVDSFKKRTTVPLVALESPFAGDVDSQEQHFFAMAAEQGLTHLLVVRTLGVGLGPLDGDCEVWKIGVILRISLSSVADKKLVGGVQLSGPYVNIQTGDMKSLLDEPHALRARFAPNFETAATNVLEQRKFVLPE